MGVFGVERPWPLFFTGLMYEFHHVLYSKDLSSFKRKQQFLKMVATTSRVKLGNLKKT